jgi:hypothetical protein
MSTNQKKDFSTTIGQQIKNLISTLEKRNYRANVSEIEKVFLQTKY